MSPSALLFLHFHKNLNVLIFPKILSNFEFPAYFELTPIVCFDFASLLDFAEFFQKSRKSFKMLYLEDYLESNCDF